MSEILAGRAIVSATDRLTLTVFLAVLLHALLILGIGFEFENRNRVRKSLEIALVDEPTRAAPEKADFLAQANQIGSGAAHKAAIPQSAKLASAGEPEPEPRPRVQVRVPKKKRAPMITRKEAPVKMESA
ncbi:MAG: hypothetical protein ACRERS_02000, partial [Methylococcales bacterium]